MKKNQKAMLTWGVVILVLVGGYFALNASESSAQEEQLAKCLTEKGAKFYGAYWCPHCANQKAMFKDAVRFIPYIECADPANPNQQNAVCTDAGVTSYPTWIFADGSRQSGEVPLEVLAQKTGCEY